MKKSLFILVVIFCFPNYLSAQLEGLWLVEKVIVGKNTMTPQHKWFQLNPNGTYSGGNGWLQNSEGTYEYNKAAKLYIPIEKNGIENDFGGFKVDLHKHNMVWKRLEDGEEVTVFLKKIEKLPKGTADDVVGLWELTGMSGDESELEATQFNSVSSIFIRWDRVYRATDKSGKRLTGYWVMHGHKPEIGLIPHDSEKSREYWMVKVDNQIMTWKHATTDVALSFTRKFSFD